MRDDQLLGVLHGLGIDQHSVGALALLPLVQVAWADGRVQDPERAAILDVAADRGLLDAESQRLLASWLHFRPSRRYLDRARQALVELALRDAGDLPPGTIDDIVSLSQRVARAAGGLLFGLGSVEPAERATLALLADRLRVDRARNWQELFDSLRGPPGEEAPTGEAPAEDPAAEDPADEDPADEDPAAEDPAAEDPADEDTDDADTEEDQRAPAASALPGAAPEPGVQPAGPAPRLVVLGAPGQPDVVHRLVAPPITIGRRPDRAICLRWDARASRQHCLLRVEGGRWYVVDSGSVNGTLVNGELVLERRLLGDELIKVGETVLRFERGA